MVLMNDAMCKAYFGEMHRAEYEGTLFADTDWKTTRGTVQLDSPVLEAVRQNPGKTRGDIWLVFIQQHFMQFTASEYKVSVQRLVEAEKIFSPTQRETSRLNDACELYPALG